MKEHDGGVLGANMLPFIWLTFCCDYAMLFRLTPVAPLLTEVEITWLVREDAVEGRDYDVDRVTWLWKLTSEEDWKLCENNQAGVNSRRYEPGPYSTIEKYRNDGFSIWYLNQLSNRDGSIQQIARPAWV
jgi:Rieske 2Fe-2S family protein